MTFLGTLMMLLLYAVGCRTQPGWSSSDEWSSESMPVTQHLRLVTTTSNWTSSDQELEMEIVVAQQKAPRSIEQHLLSEVKGSNLLRKKALSRLDIESALRGTCSCKKKCFNYLTLDIVRTIRCEYWRNSRPVRQQILISYLRESECSSKFRYFEVKGQSFCSKIFSRMLNINKNTMTRAKKLLAEDMAAPDSKKPKDCSPVTLNVLNWLEEYFTYSGDRMPNNIDIVLPYGIRINDIYHKYKAEQTTEEPIASRSHFFKLWKTHFPTVKAKKTNSFTKCTTCVTLERQIMKTTCSYTRAVYKKQKEEHNNRQMLERKYYYRKRESARKYPSQYLSLIIDGMDQAKTNLPHFTGRRPKNLNPVDLLKTHVTGVINHGHGGFQAFIDLNEYPHDPNLTINVLLKILHRTAELMADALPPILYLQADNCWRENKNKYVLSFCELLVTENIFQELKIHGPSQRKEDAQRSKKQRTNKTKEHHSAEQPNGSKKNRRKPVQEVNKRMEIPLTGEQKRHIWFMILMDILQCCALAIYLYLFLIIVYYQYYLTVLDILSRLRSEILLLICDHIGCYNATVTIITGLSIHSLETLRPCFSELG